jgi:hypothetical protein
MAGDPLADLRADLAKPAEPAAPKAEASGWRDPWAHIMQSVTPKLDQAGLLGSKDGYLRQVGGMVIPQNTAELGFAAMMALQPETALARWGVPLAEKVAAKGVIPGMYRAALRGLTTAGVGAATGRSAGESALLGAGGSMLGETLGLGAANLSESARSNLALGNITKDLSERFQRTIGQWLPKPKAGEAAYSPERIIRSVWNGEATGAVGQELSRIKVAHAHTPVSIIDLAPDMTESGVVFEAKALPGGQRQLGPGQALMRSVAPREMPLGEALDAIGKSRETWGEILRHAKTPEARDTAAARLVDLRRYEDTLATRADPNYANVLKQYGRTKQLQDWLDLAAPDLFDGRTGRISWDGYATLAQRLGKSEPGAGLLSDKSFTPEEIAGFGDAMRLDLERGGMVWGEPGEWPIRGVGIHAGSLPYVRPQMAQPARMPGVKPAVLTPAAVRMILGQAPLHLDQTGGTTP